MKVRSHVKYVHGSRVRVRSYHRNPQITYNGDPIGHLYEQPRPLNLLQKLFLIGAGVSLGGVLLMGLSEKAVQAMTRETAYLIDHQVEVVTETVLVKEEAALPEVLQRIAKCESGGRQAVKHQNPRDVGKFGINLDAWGKKAKQLGLDVYTEAGNEAMARYVYATRGTEDWKYSKKCWLK